MHRLTIRNQGVVQLEYSWKVVMDPYDSAERGAVELLLRDFYLSLLGARVRGVTIIFGLLSPLRLYR